MALRKLSGLNDHLFNLGNAIMGVHYPDGVFIESSSNNSVNWLQTAASIQKVDVNFFKYDPLVGYCESADDYQAERTELISEHVCKTTKFLYAWAALESAIRFIRPPKNLAKFRKEKIYDALAFIKFHFSKYKPLPVHRMVLDHYLKHLNSSDNYSNIYKHINTIKFYGPESFGLYLVYLIRNRFAHGEMQFPESRRLSDNFESENDFRIIDLSTRIVLLSIQMLFLAKYELANPKIAYTSQNGLCKRSVHLGSVFRNIHLERLQSH